MLFIECTGSPYEIGLQHGTAARTQIARCIAFYASLFRKNCNLEWSAVLQHAAAFEATARREWPALYEEMRGIADGAGRSVAEVVAVNVRTEINFGLFSDGCTALGWHGDEEAGTTWLGQNWDWMEQQKENLVVTKISQTDKPTIVQVTEAGIVGKIGFNSAGVGTLFNAIRVHGADPTRLPAHFGLRMALESRSVDEAVQKLQSYGMASSAHILLGDPGKTLGLEFTKSTFAHCLPDAGGRVVHTNHLLQDHPGETDTVWLKDSLTRVATMTANADALGAEPSWEGFSKLFEDEQNAPGSICRTQTTETGSATLFNIVMDLKRRKAVVRLGRPIEAEETIHLQL